MEEATTIGPRRRRWTRLLIPAAWILASWVLVTTFLCVFFDIRCLGDLKAYRYMMKKPPHPIWKDLALRRIHNGSDFAQTLRKHPPTKRDVYEPFTVLSYSEAGSADTVQVIATDGVLVYADASGYDPSSRYCVRWDYVFFSDPVRIRPFEEARERYLAQVRLEEDAWRIHLAIAAGQDVFLARQIERRENSDEPGYSEEAMRMYEQIYGKDNVKAMLGFSSGCELTVEVSQSLYGDLEPGTQLQLSIRDCSEADLAEPELVFLHGEEGEWYVMVPKKALEWYQSLTPEQFKEFEARSYLLIH
jgi:hypothetical protein